MGSHLAIRHDGSARISFLVSVRRLFYTKFLQARHVADILEPDEDFATNGLRLPMSGRCVGAVRLVAQDAGRSRC